jgi:hypothetical protein
MVEVHGTVAPPSARGHHAAETERPTRNAEHKPEAEAEQRDD